MKIKPKTILLFDGNKNYKEILSLYLKNHGLNVTLAKDQKTIFKKLSNENYYGLIFNIGFQTDSVLDFVSKIRSVYPVLPLLAISGEDDQDQVISLLQKGVNACLKAPLHEEELVFQLNKISSDRSEIYNPFSVRFEERTIVIPNQFSIVPQVIKNIVYNSLPIDEKNKFQIVLGLSEIVNNAIEHGNLGISYEEKKEALNNSEFYEMASKRALQPPYNSRFVTIKVKIHPLPKKVQYEVYDEGEGFDWKNMPEPDKKERLFSTSGRGIIITKHIFDEVVFNDKGNCTTLTYQIKTRIGD